MISRLLLPIEAIKRSLAFIRRSSWVWGFIYGAIVINALTFCVSFFLVWVSLKSGVEALTGFFSLSYGGFVGAVISLIIFVLTVFLTLFIYSALSSLATAPLYGELADRILKKELKIIDITKTISWQRSLWLALSFEIKKLCLNVGILIITLPLNLIPFLGQFLFIIINILQLVIITGLDLFEPILVYKSLTFRKKISLLNHDKVVYWPFLGISGLILAIPVLNIIIFPFVQIAAIFLFHHQPFTDGD